MKFDRPVLIGLTVFVVGAGFIVYTKVQEQKNEVPAGMIMIDGVLMPAEHQGMSAAEHANMMQDMQLDVDTEGVTPEPIEEPMDMPSAQTDGEAGTEVQMGMPVPGDDPVNEMEAEMMDEPQTQESNETDSEPPMMDHSMMDM